MDEKLLADLRAAAVELYRLLGAPPLDELPLTPERKAALQRALAATEDEVSIPTVAEWLATVDTASLFPTALTSIIRSFGQKPLTEFATMSGHMLQTTRDVDLEVGDMRALRHLLAKAGLHLGMQLSEAEAAYRESKAGTMA